MAVNLEIEHAKLANDFKHLQSGVAKIDGQLMDNLVTIMKVEAKSCELERRLVTHSDRHEKNYDELNKKFDSFGLKFTSFEEDVLAKLNKMAGRDSVLKFIFGCTCTIIVGIVIFIIQGLIRGQF